MLNFSDLTIYFHCPHCWLMLVLCTIEVGDLFSLCEKNSKSTAHPSLKRLTGKFGEIRQNRQFRQIYLLSFNSENLNCIESFKYIGSDAFSSPPGSYQAPGVPLGPYLAQNWMHERNGNKEWPFFVCFPI